MGKLNAKEYFESVKCPAVSEVSERDLKGIILHMISLGINLDEKRVLSLGCGNGQIEVELLKIFTPLRLTCVDYSSECLKNASEILEAEFIQSDVCDLSLPDNKKYDVIYSVYLAQYLTQKQLHKLNSVISKYMAGDGKLYYIGIPDSRRRFLYRINNALIMENSKYLLPNYDFIDEFSMWHKRKNFIERDFTTRFITPSYKWERFDAILQRE